jgi:NADH:ubiquinone oxidoreductase 24 kD subunit
MADTEPISVELCMGSSCFARGNSRILADIEAFLSENGLEDKVSLEGHLCLNKCNDGPHITINGVPYSGLSSECVIDLIRKAVEEKK